MKYRPSRTEFLFRFWASLGALALTGVAVAIKGVQVNIVTVEMGIITLAFLGGSAVHAAWNLWGRKDG
ncbi:MAG: hypothetical protein HKP37_13055 [Boseongicola sp.]|nr:hypothetical protein [Boseongicola sp.]